MKPSQRLDLRPGLARHLCVGIALAVLLAPAASLAGDPLYAGLGTAMGTHPIHGSDYSGFWRIRNDGNPFDYSLLTNGTSTFLNAPSTAGNIYLRAGNGDMVVVHGNTAEVDFNGRVIAHNSVIVNGVGSSSALSASADSGRGVYATSNTLYAVQGTSTSSWGGVFFGQSGVFASGTDYGVYSNGRAYVAGPLDVTGTASKPGGGVWESSSDRRVKKEVTDFRPGLADLEQVRTIWYKYNGLGGTTLSDRRYVGVVAQDLEQIAPFMVSSQRRKLQDTDEQTTDIKQVDSSAFTYMLINAVKELSGTVKGLTAENRQLKRILCKDHPREAICGTKLASVR